MAKQPVKLKYTYEERRGEEGQKLALPPVFAWYGRTTTSTPSRAGAVAALFATPAVLGAAAFAVNELKPVPVTYGNSCGNRCVGCTRQFFTKSFLGDDVAVLARSSGEQRRHAIERRRRRWRGGRRDDSRERARKIFTIYTRVRNEDRLKAQFDKHASEAMKLLLEDVTAQGDISRASIWSRAEGTGLGGRPRTRLHSIEAGVRRRRRRF